MIKLSVVVCTRNRAAMLARCLAAILRDQSLNGAEIIVVDDGSTDRSVEVARRWAARSGSGLEIIEERAGGLSRARNVGLSAASYAHVAFIDDDALVVEGWGGAIHRAFLDSPAVAIGGRTCLLWPSSPPPWLDPEYFGLYAEFDLGVHPRDLGDGVYPVGANMAFNRDVILEMGGFPTGLGRDAESLLSNEEVDVFRRLRAGGAVVGYAPAALALHVVGDDRTRISWAIRRLHMQGRSDVALDRLQREDGPGLLSDIVVLAVGGKGVLLRSAARQGLRTALMTQALQLAYVAGRVSERFAA